MVSEALSWLLRGAVSLATCENKRPITRTSRLGFVPLAGRCPCRWTCEGDPVSWGQSGSGWASMHEVGAALSLSEHFRVRNNQLAFRLRFLSCRHWITSFRYEIQFLFNGDHRVSFVNFFEYFTETFSKLDGCPFESFGHLSEHLSCHYSKSPRSLASVDFGRALNSSCVMLLTSGNWPVCPALSESIPDSFRLDGCFFRVSRFFFT